MPEALVLEVRELIAEYETKETPEAICARDAEKLECLFQGIEYRAQVSPSGGSTTAAVGSSPRLRNAWLTDCSARAASIGCATPWVRAGADLGHTKL